MSNQVLDRPSHPRSQSKELTKKCGPQSAGGQICTYPRPTAPMSACSGHPRNSHHGKKSPAAAELAWPGPPSRTRDGWRQSRQHSLVQGLMQGEGSLVLTLGLDADKSSAWAYGVQGEQGLPESRAPMRGQAVTITSCCRVP